MSNPNLPPLPTVRIDGKEMSQVWFRAHEVRAYAEEAVRQALAELQPVGCCLSTTEGRLYSFASMRAADEVKRNGILMNQSFHHLYLIPEKDHG